MTLDKLQTEMITAMKSGDKFRKGVISELIGSIKTAAINKNCRDNITEEFVNEVLLKCKKTTQEMIVNCPVDRGEILVENNKERESIKYFTSV